MFANNEFKGPINLSHKVYLQSGDQSANSNNDSGVYHQPFLRENTSKISDEENDEIIWGSKPKIYKSILAIQIKNAFINNLWNHTYLRKLHQLTSYQILQIDDLQIETGTTLKSIVHFWNLIEVFTPYNKFVIFWNLFQILTHLLIFFWLPYKISFQIHSMSQLFSEYQNYSIEIIILLILILDVAVGMNMAFIKKGQIVRIRILILHHYLNQSAFADIISFLTVLVQFLVPNFNSETNYIIFIECTLCFIFYVLRIAKINKILASIQEFLNLSGYLNDLVGLLKVLTVIVGVVHIFGCLWHGISYYNTQYSWLDAYNLRNQPNFSKYNMAVYWAMMTITTVGYGDITGKNDLELLINNLTMFFGSIVFAYSVNSIGIFVSNMYKGKIEHSQTISLINTFMSKNHIQFELQTKIRSYLEYIWQEEQNINDEQVGSIINKLSKNLQEEIQYQLRGNILKQCKTMVKLFSESFLKNLLRYMEEQSYSPEERIISMGVQDDCALYIITKGEVELIYEGIKLNEKVKKNILKIYGQFDSFGEIAFLTGNQRTLTAVSNDFTRVMKIKRKYFLSIIKSFPDDYEKYCDAKDKSSFNDFSKLQLNCFSCQCRVHMVDQCHFLHFCTDKDRLIKKELYPIQQERNQNYQRNENRFIQNSLAILQQINESAKELNKDLLNKTDEHEFPSEDEYIDQTNNVKSITDSMLHNMEFGEQQEQDFQRTTKPKQSIQTAGFGSPEGEINKRSQFKQLETLSSATSSEQLNYRSNSLTKYLTHVPTLPFSMQNFRSIPQKYENQKYQRKSIEKKSLTSANQIVKSEIEIKQNGTNYQRRTVTILNNNQADNSKTAWNPTDNKLLLEVVNYIDTFCEVIESIQDILQFTETLKSISPRYPKLRRDVNP